METQHNSDKGTIKLVAKKNKNKQTGFHYTANEGLQLFLIEFFIPYSPSFCFQIPNASLEITQIPDPEELIGKYRLSLVRHRQMQIMSCI